MIKQQIIKDKQKLFRKLFISPSYCQPLDPPLLVSPDFINLLLEQSAKASKQYQLSIVNDILNVFAQRPTNSLLLCAHDAAKVEPDKCILDSIVFRIMTLIQNEEEVELYLERILLMISYYRITLRNIQKLTQWLSRSTYRQKFDHIKLMFILRLIKLYYSRKVGELKSPTYYFYLYGVQNTGIQPVQQSINEFTFKNELTIIISFNSQGQVFKPYNLFHIKTEKKQEIGLSYSNGRLKITALNDGHYRQQFFIVDDLSEQVWYRLIINISASETQCIIDNRIYKNRALVRKEKERKITYCAFGREFFGMLGSIIVSNKNVPIEKFDKFSYPYGIDSVNDLKTLNKAQLHTNMIASCLPFFVFEVRETMHCFDIFRRNHAAVGDNILIVSEPISEENIEHLGGCTLLLPLFYLARFYSKSSYPSILQDLLQILVQITKTYNIDKLEAEFEQTHFFEIMGQHLADIPHLQTKKSLSTIFKIFQSLKRQKTKLVFIHDVIWVLNIGIDVPCVNQSKEDLLQIQEAQEICLEDLKLQLSGSLSPTRLFRDEVQELICEYYKKLLFLYKVHSVLAYQSMSLAEVIYWVVQHLETNENMAFSCCLQHHLNESVLSNEMGVEQFVKLDSSHAKTHYLYVEEILANYLQHSIKTSEQNVVEEIKTLLRLFLQKYSSCFYLTILRAIKRQIIENHSKKIGKLLADPKLQIVSFLVFLSQKTINPDIISQILYIALFIQHHSSPSRKEEVTKFIVNLLRINQNIEIKNCNPIQVLVKKVRKSSLEDSKIKVVYQLQDDSKPLRNSFTIFRECKLSKVQIGKRRLSRIIARSPRPEKLSSFQLFYNIVMNQLSGQIAQAEPISEGVLYSEESILIMKEYYKLAQPTFKQSILLFLLSSLEKRPELKSINPLTTFLLQCLRQSIYVSPEETKNLLTIFTCIFSQVISNHSSISEYYSSIKFLKLSRSALSVVLPHIMSKVVKLADFGQLCDLMMVCVYEMIQSPGQSALELSQMILSQMHHHLFKVYVNKAQNGASPQDEQFFKIICQRPDKNFTLLIEDPFKKNIPQPIQQIKKKNGVERNDKDWEQLQAADIREVHVINEFGLFEVVEKKNPHSPNTKANIKSPAQHQKHENHRSQQKNNYSYKQLSYFQVYVKLFFKVMERLQADGQMLSKQKRESIISLESSSCVRKSKSNEINFSYELKGKQTLQQEFIQIVITFFRQAAYNQKSINSYIKFVLSYVIFQSEKYLNFQTNPNYFLLNLIFRICKPLINTEAKQIQQVLSPVSNNPGSLAILQFFLQFPYDLKFSDILVLKEESIQEIQSVFEPLRAKPKFSKFFAEIEDLHDLMIVGYYQKNMQKYVEDHENFVANYASQKSFRNIQKLFDTQNSAEEKTRITFLYQNQCRFRKYHYEWDQIWNNLRIYHKPYGFWMAQKFKDTVYTYPKNQYRNFKFQMSEYSSDSGLYPILEAKILQPWTIIKDNRLKKNKYINSFSEMMKPSHIKIEKQQSQNNIIANMWRGMLGLKKKSLNKLNEYDVVLICRSTKATGKLFIQNKEDLVFCYEGARQEDTHLSFQKFSLAFNRETYQKWSIFSIQKIKLHRYLLRYEALQIVFCDGRSIIFNFVNCNKDIFLKQLQKIQKQRSQISNLRLYKINKVSFFDDNFFDMKGLDPKITESWMKREISNLQYLTRVNRAASRGIYDLSQYMVVPWVVEFKKQKQPTYRDLSKTMGGLGSEERKKIINQKYYAKDPFNPYPPFFFGVVFNILIRLSPFTEYCKHLQGGKFDIPDRLFSSLVSSWRSATEEVSDVRQLIPEVYYLPQLLINIDENYFGYTQNRELIEHVEIPTWGANNPYFFTSQLRQIMESEQVSQKINEWIDLIFGCKQKGKEAEQNYNVYYYLTYEDYIDIDEDEDDIYKKSKEAQIVHFGQVPPLLFEKPHPRRNLVESSCIYQLKIIRSINLMNSLKQKPIGLKISNSQLIVCKRNQFEVYSTQSDPAALQKKKKINFQKSLTQTYFLIKKQRSSVAFLQRPYFIIWGYLSNQFRIFNKNTGEIDEEDELPSKITTLLVSKAEDLILVGLASGVLTVYEIQYGLNDIFVKRVGVESFPSAIVHISEYDGFYAITFGNYCAIYKITRSLHYICSQKKCEIKFFRSFYNALPLKQSFIMCSPLYTLIIIDNANIKSYSINGQLIKTINNNNAKFYHRFRDHQLHDVFYAVDEDKVICFSIPDLRFISILDLPECEYVIDQYILHKNCIQEIGYGLV